MFCTNAAPPSPWSHTGVLLSLSQSGARPPEASRPLQGCSRQRRLRRRPRPRGRRRSSGCPWQAHLVARPVAADALRDIRGKRTSSQSGLSLPSLPCLNLTWNLKLNGGQTQARFSSTSGQGLQALCSRAPWTGLGIPQMRRRRCSESLTNTLPDAAKHANMFAHAPCSDTVLANIILSVRTRQH